jgi:DivIVA domain-containing protein
MVQPMPEEDPVTSEHALMQEITAPLANLPSQPVHEVANVDFPVVLRGYDRLAVDAYVKRTSQLVAELDASRSPQSAVRRALERVGEEVSGILQRAHDTAERITTESRSQAEDRLETARAEADALLGSARRQSEELVAEARQEAEALVQGARQRLTELDSETDRIWEERHRIVQDARSLAAQLLAIAESATERFPAEEEGVGQLTQPFDAEAKILLPDEHVPGAANGEDPDFEPTSQDTLPIESVDPLDQEPE